MSESARAGERQAAGLGRPYAFFIVCEGIFIHDWPDAYGLDSGPPADGRKGGGCALEEQSTGQKGGLTLLHRAVGGCHIELLGNREAVVEGCQGILEYDDDVVRVRAGKLVVRFTGRNLKIRCMTADSLVVDGFLRGMEFMV
ncbi:MAG: YabP/YqfC family sporulation protein [Clostridiales bacterium]|nr:YabP/YqfC family sporulation protein [Clostridiales bacterium]